MSAFFYVYGAGAAYGCGWLEYIHEDWLYDNSCTMHRVYDYRWKDAGWIESRVGHSVLMFTGGMRNWHAYGAPSHGENTVNSGAVMIHENPSMYWDKVWGYKFDEGDVTYVRFDPAVDNQNVGWSLANDGSYLYVGGPGNADVAGQVGLVPLSTLYADATASGEEVYEWDYLISTFIDPDTTTNGDEFGFAIAATSDLVFVSSPGESSRTGAVRVYARTDLNSVLYTIAGENAGDQFGYSLSAKTFDQSVRLAVGAPGGDKVYVYEVSDGGETTLLKNIDDFGPSMAYESSSKVGFSVELMVMANLPVIGIAIGIPGNECDLRMTGDVPTSDTKGQVYVYAMDSATNDIIPGLDDEYIYTRESLQGGDCFGFSMSSFDTELMVGAPFAYQDGVRKGRVLLFEADLGVDSFELDQWMTHIGDPGFPIYLKNKHVKDTETPSPMFGFAVHYQNKDLCIASAPLQEQKNADGELQLNGVASVFTYGSVSSEDPINLQSYETYSA
jgi:hypothetical protein